MVGRLCWGKTNNDWPNQIVLMAQGALGPLMTTVELYSILTLDVSGMQGIILNDSCPSDILGSRRHGE